MHAAPAAKPHLLLHGHYASSSQIAFSSDNKTLACSSLDQSVILWDIVTGEMKRRFSDHLESPHYSNFAMSQNGKLLATVTGGIGPQLWDTVTGKLLRTIHRDHIRSCSFSPDDTILLIPYWTGGREGAIRLELLNLQTNISVHIKCDVYGIEQFCFSPDNTQLVLYSSINNNRRGFTYEISLWDTTSGRCIGPIAKSDYPWGRLGLAPDRDNMVLSRQNHIVWFDAITREVQDRKTLGTEGEGVIALSPDSRFGIVVNRYQQGYSFKRLELWDLNSGQLHWKVAAPEYYFSPISDTVFSPDGSMMASGNYDGVITIRSAQNGAIIRQLGRPRINMACLQFALDEQTLLAVDERGTLYLWNSTNGTLENSIENQGYDAPVFTTPPQGKLLALGNGTRRKTIKKKGRLKVVRTRGSTTLWERHLVEPIVSLAISADESSLAIGHCEWVSIRNARTGKLLRKWRHGGEYGAAIAYSPDGTLLATAASGRGEYDDKIKLFDACTGSLLHSLTTEEKNYGDSSAVVFSSDGRTLACGDDESGISVHIWDLNTGELRHCFKTDDAPHAIAFSPDGKLIVIGSAYNNAIWLYHLRTGKQQMLCDHASGINAIVFSPDGRRIASASNDGTVKIWDAKTRKLLASFVILPTSQKNDGITEWLSYIPTGYYTGSPGVERFLRWQVGPNIYKATKFRRRRASLAKSLSNLQK